MPDWIKLVGPQQVIEFMGVRLVGANVDNAKKLLFTLIFIAAVLLLAALLRRLSNAVLGGRSEQARFWGRQAVKLGSAVLLILGLLSIWFEDPTRLSTALGLVTAGLAFALQKVVTAIAGYFVILRGNTFNVGDRIVMGGVRGDVIALDFTQTTIMEMGQPPPVQRADPAVWVQSRQFTGRIVTISNAKIFDEPVFNYTRDFPYLWEEMTLPIAYSADRARAERILLEIAERHSAPVAKLSEQALRDMQRRFLLKAGDIKPAVYFRLTDNWLELTLRFVVEDHGVRAVKDAMSRDLLTALDAAGITVASATFEIVGLPPVRIGREPRRGAEG